MSRREEKARNSFNVMKVLSVGPRAIWSFLQCESFNDVGRQNLLIPLSSLGVGRLYQYSSSRYPSSVILQHLLYSSRLRLPGLLCLTSPQKCRMVHLPLFLLYLPLGETLPKLPLNSYEHQKQHFATALQHHSEVLFVGNLFIMWD